MHICTGVCIQLLYKFWRVKRYLGDTKCRKNRHIIGFLVLFYLPLRIANTTRIGCNQKQWRMSNVRNRTLTDWEWANNFIQYQNTKNFNIKNMVCRKWCEKKLPTSSPSSEPNICSRAKWCHPNVFLWACRHLTYVYGILFLYVHTTRTTRAK